MLYVVTNKPQQRHSTADHAPCPHCMLWAGCSSAWLSPKHSWGSELLGATLPTPTFPPCLGGHTPALAFEGRNLLVASSSAHRPLVVSVVWPAESSLGSIQGSLPGFLPLMATQVLKYRLNFTPIPSKGPSHAMGHLHYLGDLFLKHVFTRQALEFSLLTVVLKVLCGCG